jgi:protein-L-isoaspartate(D-aspartate) O-methyltransferase
MDIETARAAFAEELRLVGHVRSQRVIEAFGTVARERFLGARPWQIYDFLEGYWELPGDDPTAAYHNVLFAIDRAKELNNGQPEFWARLLDRTEIRAGDRVYHIGAGLGYYTSILAELAGPAGSVVGVEIEPGLALRARDNLADRPNVQVIEADGAAWHPGPVDVIIVNAGATRPLPVWLDALMPGGRLLLPLTDNNGRGTVFRIDRPMLPGTYAAKVVSGVGIYPCAGARTPEGGRQVARALGEGGHRFVRSLRRDPHDAHATCWLHGDGWCLSTQP